MTIKSPTARMVEYITLYRAFEQGTVSAHAFAVSFMEHWRVDRDNLWVIEDGAPPSEIAQMLPSSTEEELLEQVFYEVDQYDEEASPSDNYIDGAELLTRLRHLFTE